MGNFITSTIDVNVLRAQLLERVKKENPQLETKFLEFFKCWLIITGVNNNNTIPTHIADRAYDQIMRSIESYNSAEISRQNNNKNKN